MPRTNIFPQSSPEQLRQELQEAEGPDIRLRRAIIGLSLVGMASMSIVTLFQTGILKHLPDPPIQRFDSDAVNSSETAYHWGLPDGTITLAGHATNIVLAATGSAERTNRQPWLPLLAVMKAGAEAAVAIQYLFHEMPIVQQKWCGYCIVDAVMHIGTFALTLPEAAKAWASLSDSH